MPTRMSPMLAIRQDSGLEDPSPVAQALLESVARGAGEASRQACGAPCVVVYTQDRARPCVEFGAGVPQRSFAVIVDGLFVELVEHLPADAITCERTNHGHARHASVSCTVGTGEDACTAHAAALAGSSKGPCVGDHAGHRRNLVHGRVNLCSPDSLDVILDWVKACFGQA